MTRVGYSAKTWICTTTYGSRRRRLLLSCPGLPIAYKKWSRVGTGSRHRFGLSEWATEWVAIAITLTPHWLANWLAAGLAKKPAQ